MHACMASGNQATCDDQGFFSQFRLAVVVYNASLTGYYCAMVQYHCQTSFVRRTLEPVLSCHSTHDRPGQGSSGGPSEHVQQCWMGMLDCCLAPSVARKLDFYAFRNMIDFCLTEKRQCVHFPLGILLRTIVDCHSCVVASNILGVYWSVYEHEKK
jgi:hypothetical protein